jgi:pyruvate,water dikinase
MAFPRLLEFFKRPGNSVSSSAVAAEGKFFDKLHHSFKLFLTEWNNFQETMTQVEYTLCCDHPFGMQRVHKMCASAATQVFQRIQQLQKLVPAPCDVLHTRFAELQKIVTSVAYEPECRAAGQRVLSLNHPEGMLAGTDIAKMLSAAGKIDGVNGFVVTLAGCWHFFQTGDMQEEITRRIQAAGGPVRARLTKLSQSLGKLMQNALISAHPHASGRYDHGRDRTRQGTGTETPRRYDRADSGSICSPQKQVKNSFAIFRVSFSSFCNICCKAHAGVDVEKGLAPAARVTASWRSI